MVLVTAKVLDALHRTTYLNEFAYLPVPTTRINVQKVAHFHIH